MGLSIHRITLFLGLNILSLIIMLALVWHFRIESIFVLAAIPIIWSGWIFPRRYIFYTALFLFTIQSFGLVLFGMKHFTAPKTIIPGIIAYSTFTFISYILHLTRSMSLKIQTLNKELCEKNLELQALSFRDPLTNLHNRRYVWEFIAQQASNFTQQISTPEAHSRSLSISDKTMLVILVDLDYFKQINDQYGHDIGDQILISVGKKLCEAVRFDDVVVRWGGEEFLVLCPLVHKDNVEQVVRKVHQSISTEPMHIRTDVHIPVTASLGVVPFPPIPTTPKSISFEQCVTLADKALYASKGAGRNQVHLVQITGTPEEIFTFQGSTGAGAPDIDVRFLNFEKL